MTEIINLRQARKAQKRGKKEKEASQNRLKFGRTKEEKRKTKLEEDRAERHIEGHKRETENEDEEE